MSEQPMYPQDPFSPIKEDKKTQEDVPSARQANLQHTRSDVDTSQLAQHHTLGAKRNQASPGQHDHSGSDSKLIGSTISNLTITGKITPATVAEVDTVLDSLITQLMRVINLKDGRV